MFYLRDSDTCALCIGKASAHVWYYMKNPCPGGENGTSHRSVAGLSEYKQVASLGHRSKAVWLWVTCCWVVAEGEVQVGGLIDWVWLNFYETVLSHPFSPAANSIGRGIKCWSVSLLGHAMLSTVMTQTYPMAKRIEPMGLRHQPMMLISHSSLWSRVCMGWKLSQYLFTCSDWMINIE